jgi:hypothetical protein
VETEEETAPTGVAIQITAASDSKAYDGEALTNDGYELTGGTLNEGDTIVSVTVTGSQTEVGESANVASNARIVDANGNDVTANYVISYVDGTLSVTKRAVTVVIVGGKGNPEFNGGEQSIEGYEVIITDPMYTVDDFTFTGDATVTGRTAGTYPMGLTPEQFTNLNENFEVTFEVTDGELTIVPKAITITLNPDGTYTVEGLIENDRVDNVTVTEITREDGTTVLVPSNALIRHNNEEDVTSSYAVTYVNVVREAPPVVVRQYRLTINYWLDEVNGTQAARSFTAVYTEGTPYNVTSPTVAGYDTNTPRVSGTMRADTTLNVVYTKHLYTLTISYVYTDGTEAAPEYQVTLPYGESYSVVSPAIYGHNMNYKQVVGEMPARDVSYTVRYWVDNDSIINDYDTPLGIPSSSMSTGETYE